MYACERGVLENKEAEKKGIFFSFFGFSFLCDARVVFCATLKLRFERENLRVFD